MLSSVLPRVCFVLCLSGFCLPTLLNSQGNPETDSQDQKKPRRSQRISSQLQLETPIDDDYLPTPLTHANSTATDIRKEVTATPPDSPSHAPDFSQNVSSPPGDTQALSQFVYPPRAFADEVDDESAEGVWGYLLPLDDNVSEPFVLKKRDNCAERDRKSKSRNGQAPGGYLIGRHPECGKHSICDWIELLVCLS